jgi:hypothetical protein
MNPTVQMPPGLGVRRWSLRNRRFRIKVSEAFPMDRLLAEVPTPKR